MTDTNETQTNTPAVSGLNRDPTPPTYPTIPQVAKAFNSGTRPWYRAARDGKLRVIRINERGDLRTTWDWVREYVNSL